LKRDSSNITVVGSIQTTKPLMFCWFGRMYSHIGTETRPWLFKTAV